ncbi:MAG: aldo/keto reductase [Planctomycetota bacterium]|nr:MAG: aldo/keto reductase [Planctomycetota bacterium]
MNESDSNLSRRNLLGLTSKAALAAAIGNEVLAKTGDSPSSGSPSGDKARKIINYHPKMKYRKLGKTGLILSEISLGGHWKNRDAGSFWRDFADEKVPEDVARNRTKVVSACIDAGINYVDITTGAECLAYGVALKGRREKFIVGADNHRLCLRRPENVNVKGQTRNIEECLRHMKTDYLDIWRVQAKQTGRHKLTDLEPAVEAAEKARKAGKIRHFGLSSHNRRWLQQVIEKYPQVEMVVFPVTAMTKKKGLPITKENIAEQEQPFPNAKDRTVSIFETVRKHNVGLVTIKPFAGGNIFQSFKNKAKFPVMGVGLKEENDLARLTLKCILTRYDEITCTVPGLTTIYEVDNAARASYEHSLTITPAEREWLEEMTGERMAQLPSEYQWLRDWDVV